MRSALTDQPAWRARAYFIAKAPVELASLAAVVTLRAGSLIYLASPVEWAANLWTRQVVIGGVTHRYVINFGSFYFDTWPSMALAVLIGVAGWWLSPWVLRCVLRADKTLVASLRPSPLAVSGSWNAPRSGGRGRGGPAAPHRTGPARRCPGRAGGDIDEARPGPRETGQRPRGRPSRRRQVGSLVDAAHQGVKDAIAQLRDWPGVHPPVLDQGLGVALSSLAAKSSVPVTLSVDLPARPSPAIEASLFLCRRTADQCRQARGRDAGERRCQHRRQMAEDAGGR